MTDSSVADRVATDIELFAAFVRANPDVAERMHGETFRIYFLPGRDTVTKIVDIARRARRAGAAMTKDISGDYASAMLTFGSTITLQVYTQRDAVCERVVVGTRTKTVQEPDPDAVAALPMVTREVIIEDVEWQCTPLLAAAEDAEVSA